MFPFIPIELFTIQNVPIKYKATLPCVNQVFYLQYKMFLLNEVYPEWCYSKTTFTIQNVPIKWMK